MKITDLREALLLAEAVALGLEAMERLPPFPLHHFPPDTELLSRLCFPIQLCTIFAVPLGVRTPSTLFRFYLILSMSRVGNY
jgi:hypothetical protein